MTILVTGVAGMVGARLLPRLIEAGFDCRAIVRQGKEVPAGVTAVDADLFDAESLAQAVQGVEAIVHLAAVFRTQDNDLIWKSNLEGTRNLIAAAKEHASKARFIMASTSNIYDLDAGHPGRESDAASPQQAYPASKLAAEKELRESGLNWAVLRFSFVYGDGDGHIESLPKMAAQTKFHPAKRMSMVHQQDIATGVKLALTGALDGEIVNLADDGPPSIFELYELAGKQMAPSSEPLPNPWHLVVDNELARRLGFHPTIRTVHQAAQEERL